MDILSRKALAGHLLGADGPARVSLMVNGRRVSGTWALPAESEPGRHDFFFSLRDLWTYLGPDDCLQVCAGDRALPLAGGGEMHVPQERGSATADLLFDRLDEGWLFDKKGRLQLSKLKDVAWQQLILDGYERLRADFLRLYDYHLFPCYGSMLGAVREGHFIGNDDDFDTAYVSRFAEPARLRGELKRIARDLVRLGYDVWLGKTCVHVEFAPRGRAAIDIFTSYFDEQDRLLFPFGLAGTEPYRRADLTGWTTATIGEHPVTIPANPEKLLAWTYGEGWRVPDPTFNWDRARKVHVPEVFPARQDRREVFWEHHHASADGPAEPSPFARMLADERLIAGAVVDLGCGSGGDALVWAEAAAGPVLGLDRALSAISRARRANRHLAPRPTFAVCDVTRPPKLAALTAALRAAGEPITYVARLLPNMIDTAGERKLFAALRALLRPGDRFACEVVTGPGLAGAARLRRAAGRVIDPAAFEARVQALGLVLLHRSARTDASGDRLLRIVAERRPPQSPQQSETSLSDPSEPAVSARSDYWNSFYARTAAALPLPSQFAVFVLGEAADRSFVADVGCGSGRDTLFFADRGHQVIGIDGSTAAVEACRAKAERLGSSATFEAASVAGRDFAAAAIRARGELTARDTVVYARFFLHAITEEEEASFLSGCASICAGGGLLAVEFRTLRDAAQSKVTPDHYRRFIDPLAFIGRARAHGFTATYFVEGFGFAKYKDDDAHVARFQMVAD